MPIRLTVDEWDLVEAQCRSCKYWSDLQGCFYLEQEGDEDTEITPNSYLPVYDCLEYKYVNKEDTEDTL